MDWKDLLKESGLVLAALVGLVYACGWQFHLAFLHGMHVEVPFLIPLENALGAGVQPFFTVFLWPCVFVSLLAWTHRFLAPQKLPHLGRVLLLAAIACGASLPAAMVFSTQTWRPASLATWQYVVLAAAGAPLGAAVFVLVQRFERIKKSNRYAAYALIFLLFLASSVYYANTRGRQAARDVLSGVSGRARLRVTDPSLQAEFGASSFVPILETREDLWLLRFGAMPDATASLLVIKRADVRSLEYSIKSDQPVK